MQFMTQQLQELRKHEDACTPGASLLTSSLALTPSSSLVEWVGSGFALNTCFVTCTPDILTWRAPQKRHRRVQEAQLA